MKPPCSFKIDERKHGWSLCDGCNEWKKNLTFYHEDKLWILCIECWGDYWFNIDELQDNYKPPWYKGKKLLK